MTAWPKFVLFDRALPVSQSAAVMVCGQGNPPRA